MLTLQAVSKIGFFRSTQITQIIYFGLDKMIFAQNFTQFNKLTSSMRSLLQQNNFCLRCLNYKQTRSVCGLRSVVNPQHIMVCPVPNAINFRGKKQPKVRLVAGYKTYLSLQVHIMFQQQLEDVHMAILAGCLHGSVSCTLPVHLETKRQG